MSFNLPAIPDVFVRVPMEQAAREMQLSESTKRKLLEEVVSLHNESAEHRVWIKRLETVLGNEEWDWPRCRELLVSEGIDPNARDILDTLVSWLIFSAHKLMRRGEIRVALKGAPDSLIEVSLDIGGPDLAPCGRRDGDTFKPTSELMRQMPPCGHLRCKCSWTTRYVFQRG
ncbi:hypothetical protein [Marinobacterium litorale]|uniref:hypothetical protein n=1 Tax=Marinobacterium litorale TaxID=404770 RepID=UPI00041A4CC6|nr:hypothetical protein [Marinobacterium litorale]